MDIFYLGRFDPAHVGHRQTVELLHEQLVSASTLTVLPVDAYDGALPGRRWVRSRYASLLITGLVQARWSENALQVSHLDELLRALAGHAPAKVVVDSDLECHFQPDGVRVVPAGVELVRASDALAAAGVTVTTDAARVATLLRSDPSAGRQLLVEGAAAVMEQVMAAAGR